jgi:hypothetical protein
MGDFTLIRKGDACILPKYYDHLNPLNVRMCDGRGFEEKQFSIPIDIRVCIRLINGILGTKCVTSNLVAECV